MRNCKLLVSTKYAFINGFFFFFFFFGGGGEGFKKKISFKINSAKVWSFLVLYML